VIWLAIFIGLVVCFAGVLLFGAPYVPTLKKQQADALDLLSLKPGQILIELGSGDGRMLRAAAERGVATVGYELNPVLVLISYIVCYKYRKDISIHWGNFWAKEWPATDAIYVFLLDKYMDKLDKKVTQQYKGRHVKLVSYAFEIPNKKPTETKQALYLYDYK
jgi:hypothetical protein